MVGAPESVENIMTEWLGLPALAAAHGGQIDNLLGWIHIFMLILFVGWGGFFAYTLVRFRRSRNPVANYTGVKSHAVELTPKSAWPWSKGSSSSDSRSRSGPRGSIAFRRRAKRWSCTSPPSSSPGTSTTPAPTAYSADRHRAARPPVEPPGLDRSDPAAKDDVTTLNQLYLPVNTPVILKLRSKDVIHSFGVPEFRVKQDTIPGLTIPIWFVPTSRPAEMRTRTGNPEFQYEIACAQLCGLGHYRMRGFVTVLARGVPEVDGGRQVKLEEQDDEAIWQ
jgi:cytochrome c oxidase subunit II